MMGLIDFMIPLGLTLFLEGVIALFWGLRRKDLLLFVLVNVLTNPAAVLLHALFSEIFVTILLEMGAILIEAFCYDRLGEHVKKPLLFALLANVFSFGLGLVLGQMIGV